MAEEDLGRIRRELEEVERELQQGREQSAELQKELQSKLDAFYREQKEHIGSTIPDRRKAHIATKRHRRLEDLSA
jgi:hypothetical protein